MSHLKVGKIGHIAFQLSIVATCVKRALSSGYEVAKNA